MGLSFVNGGVRGEVSALPDRIDALIPENGINGIAFVDFAYASDSVGHSSHAVEGLQIGACHAPPRTRLIFEGDGLGQGGRPIVISGDAFVLRSPGHAGQASWNGAYRARYLSLTPSAIERITEAPLSRLVAGSAVTDLAERMRIYHLLAALGHEHGCEVPSDPLYVESVALAVIRASGILPGEPWRRSPTLTSAQAARIRALVAAGLTEPLSLGDMARAAGLSESYFVRAFKGSFGVTPYRYVLRERVALAQSLIRSGTVSLSEAALRSGFPDARRMGRTFRQITGRSPTAATRRTE